MTKLNIYCHCHDHGHCHCHCHCYCHCTVGNNYVGAFCYADDLTLISPTLTRLTEMYACYL